MKDNKAVKKLLRLLNYDLETVQKDLEVCLQLGDTLDEQAKARASAMVQSDKFRIWLAEDASSRSLLVNAHLDLEAAEAHSPLSVVDAELVKAFQDSASVFLVKYFCSLHTENIDPSRASSSIGMISSLVGQLLTQMLDRDIEVDLSFLSKTDLKKVESDDIDILCILFRELTLQLPSKTLLVCVLDEVSLYETLSLGKDTDAVMRRLTRLLAKPMEAVFKLLVTSRGQSLDFQQYFEEVDILDLQEDTEVDDSALWKIRNIGDGS
jgi:hypothetical protein